MQNLVSSHPIYQQAYAGGMPPPGNFALAPAPMPILSGPMPALRPEGVAAGIPTPDIWAPQGTALEMPLPSVTLPQTLAETPTAPVFNARIAAEEFARATWRKAGTDMDEVSQILKTAHAHGDMDSFSKAVAMLAQREGKSFEGPQAAVMADLASNPLKAFLNQAALQEVQDLVRQGEKSYRSSPIQYRLRGMWDSVENFFQVWNQHKIVGTLAMGLAAMMGRKFPFVGGLAGGAILLCSSVMIGFHELKAKAISGMNEEKAQHYEKSGENLTAFLMTLIGVDGIKRELQSGLKASKATTSTLEGLSFPRRALSRLWQAIKLRSGPDHKPEGWRFVIGLFDEVLMPFNQLAEKSKKSAIIEDDLSMGMNPVSA